MKSLRDNGVTASTLGSPAPPGDTSQGPSWSNGAARPRQTARTTVRWENWNKRSARWGHLMIEAQAGDGHAYDQLLRELDVWLRRYYARRLSHPAAEDARQDALLAIARYKWVDRNRDASRYSALSLDEEMPVEDHGRAAISAATLDLLLGRLKPAQASVIRLVKLRGLSVAHTSGATGQSAALVKINIHRGLKKLAALVS